MKLGVRGLRFLVGGLLVCLLLASCGKTEKKRRTVGYKGEARSNAFLGAQRLLEKQGKEVVSKYGIGELDYEISTVFLPQSSLSTVGRAKRISEWVNNGGHLIVMIAGGEKRGNDFRRYPADLFSIEDDAAPGLEHLLDELGVEMIEWETESVTNDPASMGEDDWEALDEKDRALLGTEEVTISMGGRKIKIHHWSTTGLEYELDFDGEYGTGKNKHRYLSVYYGSGRVTFLTDASPLRNRYIGHGDHAKFISKLVAHSRQGTVIFSSGDGEGFFGLVWKYFWMAVLGLLAVVILWLWKNLPRYGPEQDLPDGGMREFSGQVRGIGRFLWRHKRDDAMLTSLRASISRQLSMTADGNHEGIFDQLALGTGLPVESIIEAMTRQQVREPGVMVRIVKNLQLILKHIN